MSDEIRDLILAQAKEIQNLSPTPERAAELAATLERLMAVVREASTDMPFDSAPSDYLSVLDEVGER